MNKKTVAIIDYGSGNLRSAAKSFERSALTADGNFEVIVTSAPEIIAAADYLVLPGVGAYADCKAGFEAIDGLHEALFEATIEKARPFIGICVGMQLMASRGLEKTITEGFNWFKGDVVKIEPQDSSLKVPQIGWNILNQSQVHPVLNGIETGKNGLHAYFVHSYHMQLKNQDDCIATTEYGGDITAIIARDNMVGTQFHPEKSQTLGLKLIENFLNWKP
jgi:glutamine amidotransferase